MGAHDEQDDRTLSDGDLKAIIDGLEKRVIERFQTNIGRGVISFFTTWIIRGAVLLAVYGAGANSSSILKKLGI